jgi:hypothetical protein
METPQFSALFRDNQRTFGSTKNTPALRFDYNFTIVRDPALSISGGLNHQCEHSTFLCRSIDLSGSCLTRPFPFDDWVDRYIAITDDLNVIFLIKVVKSEPRFRKYHGIACLANLDDFSRFYVRHLIHHNS